MTLITGFTAGVLTTLVLQILLWDHTQAYLAWLKKDEGE